MPDQEKRRFWEFGRKRQPDAQARPRNQPSISSITANDCDPYHMLGRLQGAAAIGCVLVIAYSVQFRGTGESLKIAAVGIAIAGGALFLGFLAGFIFCIPRAAKPQHPDKNRTVASTTDKSTTSEASPSDSFDDNSNLVEISDWVTKILVGAGLVELTKIPHALWGFCAELAPGLGACGSAACTGASQAFALALLLFFFPIGFLIGYIWTRLYYQETLSKMRKKIDRLAEETVARQSLYDAVSFMQYDDPNKALVKVERAVNLEPENGRALFERGRIRKKLAESSEPMDSGLLREALNDMSAAARLLPEKGSPVYNLACYRNLLKYPKQEVLDTLRRAFAIDPSMKKIAETDPDFASLHGDPDFQALIGS